MSTKGKPRKYISGNTTRRNVSLDPELDRKVVDYAYANRLFKSEVVSQALELFFAREEPGGSHTQRSNAGGR